jgi:mono/diheme cytochrome c family protein
MLARVTLGAIAVASLAACTSTPAPSDPQLSRYDGAQLFAAYCVACHGQKGEGNGAAASLLKSGVPDLTQISARAGGTFPEEDVRKIIAGTSSRPGHGERNMPIWEWQFYDTKSSDVAGERARAELLIGRLVQHVKSLQRAP